MALSDNTTGEGSSSGSTASSAQRDPIASQLEQIKTLLQQQSQTLDACLAHQLQKDVDIDRRRAEVDERDEQLRAQVAELVASRPLRGPTHPSHEEVEVEHEALLRYIRQEHESRKAMIQSAMSECMIQSKQRHQALLQEIGSMAPGGRKRRRRRK